MKAVEKLLTNVRVSLFMIALLSGILINSGELGSVDVERRLQVTHSMWTGEPNVKPEDYPAFGLVGREGKIYAWYGLGQSLVMLPADIIATKLLNTLKIKDELKSRIRSALVSLLTFPLITAFVVLVAHRFLLALDFASAHAALGALVFLFGTTLLSYTQINQENSLSLLMTLCGFLFVHQWARTRSRLKLFYASCALGFNLLMRLTSMFDIFAVALFAALLVWHKFRIENLSSKNFVRIIVDALTVAAPTAIIFLIIDRVYHWARFESLTGTYMGIYGEQTRMLNPTLPPTFPFNKPFSEGFWGALISPEKSIFLFDPLLLIALILVIKFRRHIPEAIRSYFCVSLLLLIIYVAFHARLDFWSGGGAWGDRYVTVPVHLLALLAVPLLLKFNEQIRAGWEKRFYLSVVIISIVTQLASVALWFQLEENQIAYFRRATYAIGLRFTNLAAIITGNFEAWNLSYPSITPRMTTINFMPFLAAKFLPASLSVVLQLAWFLVLMMLVVWTVFFVARCFRGALLEGRDSK